MFEDDEFIPINRQDPGDVWPTLATCVVVTGYPGVGKTTAIKKVIAMMEDNYIEFK